MILPIARKLSNGAEGLSVSFEMIVSAMVTHQLLQFHFTDMPKRRMPQIMGMSRGFSNIGIQHITAYRVIDLKPFGKATSHLGYFEGMGQPIMKNVTFKS